MKKALTLMVIVLAFVMVGSGVAASAAGEDSAKVTNSAKSAYLIDYATGTVLYERNPDEKLPIASMVKIMTLVLTFENIENGNLSLEQKITVSDTAAGMGGSQMFLDAGKEYTVSDLIKGIVVCSANDASVAIAETLSGSKEAFVDMMNEKAKSLGMENTAFVNVTGLPQEGQYSTAKDVTLMMRRLLKNPVYYNYSTIYMENYAHPDGRITELVNTNKLIRFYKGCDAGKTGFTNAAMFCLSASAVKSDMRVVATVIGAPDSKSRFAEVSSLFNYAFANYKQERVVNTEDIIQNDIEVLKGKESKIEVRADKDIYYLTKKGDKSAYAYVIDIPETVKAPVKAGDIVGKIIVKAADGTVYDTANIIAVKDIDTIKFTDSLRKILDNWFLKKHK